MCHKCRRHEAHSVSVQCLHGWSLIIILGHPQRSPEAAGVSLWCHAPLWFPIVPPPDACKVYKGHFHGHLWLLCPVSRDNGPILMSQVSPSDPNTGLKAVSPLSLTNSLDLPLYSFCLRATSLQIRCLVTVPGAAWPNYCSLCPILVLIRSWSDTSRQMTNKQPDALRVEIYWYWLSWLIKI